MKTAQTLSWLLFAGGGIEEWQFRRPEETSVIRQIKTNESFRLKLQTLLGRKLRAVQRPFNFPVRKSPAFFCPHEPAYVSFECLQRTIAVLAIASFT